MFKVELGPRDILAPLGLVLMTISCGLACGWVAGLGVLGAFMAALGVER